MKDPYVYPDSNVLKNKFNIQKQDLLDKAEADISGLSIRNIKNSNFQLNTIFDCLKIHEQLFLPLYEWAGKPRTIDIYKSESILDGLSIDYVFASYINEALKELNNEFINIDWDSLSNELKIQKICYFVSEFWHIHPFREGNTRTSATMLYLLIKKANLHINTDFISKNSKFFRNALVMSCLYSKSKSEYLTGIVTDAVTLKNESSKKYETINGVEVNKYSYSNHTLQKIKTIKKPSDLKK